MYVQIPCTLTFLIFPSNLTVQSSTLLLFPVGNISPGEKKVCLHSRSIRGTLMRDKCHLVLICCTAPTYRDLNFSFRKWALNTSVDNFASAIYWSESKDEKSYKVWFALTVKFILVCQTKSHKAFFFPFTKHVQPALFWFVQVTASLVSPLPIPGPAFTLRHLPFYHRWACNCSVAWSCSSWLRERAALLMRMLPTLQCVSRWVCAITHLVHCCNLSRWLLVCQKQAKREVE